MKRKELVKYLQANGSLLLREGQKHSVCLNKLKNKVSFGSRVSRIN
jgi:hypothetical protein